MITVDFPLYGVEVRRGNTKVLGENTNNVLTQVYLCATINMINTKEDFV